MADIEIKIELHHRFEQDYFRMTVLGMVVAFDQVVFNNHWYLEYENAVVALVGGQLLEAMQKHPLAIEHGLFE